MTVLRDAGMFGSMPGDPDEEILIETNRIGGAMEVRAISASDGLEVAFTAPSNAAQSDINRLARQKLAYVRRKLDGEGGGSGPPDDGKSRGGGRGGIIA